MFKFLVTTSLRHRLFVLAAAFILVAYGSFVLPRIPIDVFPDLNRPIVTLLTEQVSDAHLAGLREDRVSYIFAGERELDLGLALEILNRELGIERLLLEGGGGSNGAFLRAGLIDEVSLAICPAVDGAKGAPSIFDSTNKDAGIAAPISSMTLASCEVVEGGAVWLRYRLQNN